MKRIVLFLLFGFWILDFGFNTQLNAQLSPLATGLQKYRQGDLENAITDFETALSQDQGNEKIQSYLFNCYLSLGVKYAEEKNYDKAVDCLDRAQRLNPSDQEVADLYQSLRTKAVSEPAAAVPEPPAKKKEVAPPAPVVKEEAPVTPPEPPAVPVQAPAEVTQPPAEVTQPPAKEEKVSPPVLVIEEAAPPASQQPEVVPQLPVLVPQMPVIEEAKPAPEVPKPAVGRTREAEPRRAAKPAGEEIVRGELETRLELMLARIDRDREELLKRLASWEEKEKEERQRVIEESRKFMRRTIIIVGAGLLFLTFIILGPIYSNVKKTTKDKDKMFREYEKRITRMIEEHKQSLNDFIALQTQPKIEETGPQQETTAAKPKSPPAEPLILPEEILKGATPELRLRAISIIEKELNYKDETEKAVAMRLLEPFLSDKDKKIQFRAAETLDKYTPEKTANFWRNLISKGDKKIFPEMMHNLTSLPPIGRAEMLVSFLNHPDARMKKEVLLNLEQLVKTKKDELPPVVISRIREIIEKRNIDREEAKK